VPTCIFKFDPPEEESNTLTCILYSLFFTVDTDWFAAAAFSMNIGKYTQTYLPTVTRWI